MMKYSRAFSLEGKSLLGGNSAWVKSSLARNAVKKCHPDSLWPNMIQQSLIHLLTFYTLQPRTMPTPSKIHENRAVQSKDMSINNSVRIVLLVLST